MPRIAIRVDGYDAIGRGHIIRCLALAEELKRLNSTIDFYLYLDDLAENQIYQAGFSVTRLADEADVEVLIQQFGDKTYDIFINDFGRANEPYLQRISQLVPYVVQIDIHRDMSLPVNLIVNGGIYALSLEPMAQKYQRDTLLGARYNLLRPEFGLPFERSIRKRIKTILIALGASDIHKISQPVILQMHRLVPEAMIHLVLGTNYHPVLEQIDTLPYVHLHQHTNQMRELMLSSDIAIASGGVTLYELAATGTPSVIITQAENQVLQTEKFYKHSAIADFFSAKGYSDARLEEATSKLLRDVNYRKDLSEKMREIVDGRGASRVAEYILTNYQSS